MLVKDLVTFPAIDLLLFHLQQFLLNFEQFGKLMYEKYEFSVNIDQCKKKKKFLGMKWDKLSDVLISDFNEFMNTFNLIPTKRNVIIAISFYLSSIRFDELYCLQMQMYFQQLFLAKYTCNNKLTVDYLNA